MRQGGKRWFRVAGVVLLVAVVVLAGGWWNSQRTDPDSQVISDAQAGGSADPQGDESRECLDGALVSSGEQCADLQSNEVMFAAVGVTEDRCTADRVYAWNAPGQSFTCTIGSTELHVARYRSASRRADRVAEYKSCSRLDGGWKLCGKNPKNQRYVRTYIAEDLLFYVSSTDKQALLDLDAASETDVRNGR